MPVVSARTTPRTSGRKAVMNWILERSGGGVASTSRGISGSGSPEPAARAGRPSDGPPAAALSVGRPSSAILQVLDPHAIVDPVVTALSVIRTPSTRVPLAESWSEMVIRSLPTDRVAWCRDNPGSRIRMLQQLRPMVCLPRPRGMSRPASGPVEMTRTREGSEVPPTGADAPATTTAPFTSGKSPGVSVSSGRPRTVRTDVPASIRTLRLTLVPVSSRAVSRTSSRTDCSPGGAVTSVRCSVECSVECSVTTCLPFVDGTVPAGYGAPGLPWRRGLRL